MNNLCQLDHVVMAARNIDEGVEYLRELTGLEIPPGGFHPMMGTHNHLMQIGRGAFFEIIAIDPAAPAPQRPRWYGLDDNSLQQTLSPPRLITWVVNTGNLDTLVSRSAYQTGPGIMVTRGNLNWRLTVAEDGGMPNGGLLPSIIQWLEPGNPCPAMPDLGCKIQKLKIFHPYPKWYQNQIDSICAMHLIELLPLPKDTPGYFELMLATPSGSITLSSTP